jgi:hypothetical protein
MRGPASAGPRACLRFLSELLDAAYPLGCRLAV